MKNKFICLILLIFLSACQNTSNSKVQKSQKYKEFNQNCEKPNQRTKELARLIFNYYKDTQDCETIEAENFDAQDFGVYKKNQEDKQKNKKLQQKPVNTFLMHYIKN